MSYKRRRSAQGSTVVTLRVPDSLNRSIERAARRGRRSKSELLREILERGLREQDAADPAAEARRQSLLVSGKASEREALAFIERSGDARGWR